MRNRRRTETLVSLGLLAWASVALLARALAAATEEPPPAADAPAVQGPQLSRADLLAALRSKIPIDPLEVAQDPYLAWQGQASAVSTGTVCGVQFQPDQIHYRLSTFADPDAARMAGAAVTHYGACGTCSTLQDLAVYLEKPDLTAPVRSCAINWSASASLTCLEGLGFTHACAQTWLYDAQNTRRQCLGVCVMSWIEGEASTRSDGRLNACLQCDEDRSGPVFKAVAGRTRRNSGIHSSIPRPDDQIAPVVHDYLPELAPK
jgi:hypothetical protein